MPTLDEVAAQRARYQAGVNARTVAALAATWARLGRGGTLAGAWRAGAATGLLAATTGAQALAATGATEYVAAAVQAQGGEPDPLGAIDPAAFAGLTAEGGELEPALYLPVITVKQELAKGTLYDRALTIGFNRLTRFVLSEVGNSARLADGSALALDRAVTGYVRRLSMPSCGRCIIQAGKFFKRNEGFQRHPRCDCFHVPATREYAGKLAKAEDPRQLFDSMTRAQQDAALGKANAEAARAGADLGQVVNAASGMRAPGDRYTKAGTTVRGQAGRQLAQEQGTAKDGGRYRRARQGRLTPAAILAEYGDDADRYAAALAENGYL